MVYKSKYLILIAMLGTVLYSQLPKLGQIKLAPRATHLTGTMFTQVARPLNYLDLQLQEPREQTIFGPQINLQHVPNLIPVMGRISSSFGMRNDPFSHRLKQHHGIDIAAAPGSPVFAPADGLVFVARNNRSFGNLIEITHTSGFNTRFAHLNKILVKKGQRVERGQVIGLVGNTGTRSRGAHLHYEVRYNNQALDPVTFLLNLPTQAHSAYLKGNA